MRSNGCRRRRPQLLRDLAERPENRAFPCMRRGGEVRGQHPVGGHVHELRLRRGDRRRRGGRPGARRPLSSGLARRARAPSLRLSLSSDELVNAPGNSVADEQERVWLWVSFEKLVHDQKTREQHRPRCTNEEQVCEKASDPRRVERPANRIRPLSAREEEREQQRHAKRLQARVHRSLVGIHQHWQEGLSDGIQECRLLHEEVQPLFLAVARQVC
mmetsp:Transcript_31664/g.87429  ORF Transcript_31664/g.87429 Transcript_31664/m.87429 type:complete len:216 (+) Transcript_31664:1546-2193(+)